MDKKPWYEKLNNWIGIIVGIFTILGVSVFGGKSLTDFNKNSKTTKTEQQSATNQPTTIPLVEEKEKDVDNSIEHVHKKFEIKKENIVKSECEQKGSYDSVTYCECGQELKRKTITTKALKHKYKKGVCIRCGYKDPDYVKIYNSKEIIKILSKSVVSDSGTYADYLGSDSISVFAKDRHNCFSLNTAVSYNLWGGNVQTVVFNTSDLKKLKKLKFKIGGETGCSGAMQVEIFINKTFDAKANYVYQLDASAIPIKASINIQNATSLGIRVTNNSTNQNRIVFYRFSS